jgi:transcriptional regulator with GAF, ATPase, and Fis domain
MANTIIPGLLNDTLNLVQLARESALVQGKAKQANKLTPVVDDLKNMIKTSDQTRPPTATGGVLMQSDFKKLLDAAKTVTSNQRISTTTNIAERNQMVRAMSGSNMSEVDIARQLGMTREEVRMITSLSSR